MTLSLMWTTTRRGQQPLAWAPMATALKEQTLAPLTMASTGTCSHAHPHALLHELLHAQSHVMLNALPLVLLLGLSLWSLAVRF